MSLSAGELRKNKKKYKVLTPDGFKDFAGVSCMGHQRTIRLEFEKGIFIESTPDHKIYINDKEKIPASELVIGDYILTSAGRAALLNILYAPQSAQAVYDLVEVEGGNRFYANGALVSNCEFISYDETLIDALTLTRLKGIDPIDKMGQVRWFKKPSKNHAYLVALDPSLGTGGDNAAIQVFEMPEMEQVAEWMHNKTPISKQINLLSRITTHIVECTGDTTSAYYSVENNTLGEAALVSIAEIGEENISGVFLTEPHRRGNSRAFRRGFNTTNKSKLAACAKLKSLIESNRMKINSGPLVSELKVFISRGPTYEAKEGETDDLVMASILAVRMAQTLQSYDPTLDATLRDKLDADIMPLPFIIL